MTKVAVVLVIAALVILVLLAGPVEVLLEAGRVFGAIL